MNQIFLPEYPYCFKLYSFNNSPLSNKSQIRIERCICCCCCDCGDQRICSCNNNNESCNTNECRGGIVLDSATNRPSSDQIENKLQVI